jgi:hypothetical protein
MTSPVTEPPRDAAQHFRLRVFVAIARLIERSAEALGGEEPLLERFPFLGGYAEELAASDFPGCGPGEDVAGRLEAEVVRWEEGALGHLPLRALGRAAGLDGRALGLLLSAGLVEEDARFGLLFEALQGTSGAHRPAQGLLDAWWREPVDRGEARAALRRLRVLGLLVVSNPDAPRSEWLLHVPPAVWEALRGETPEVAGAGLRHLPLAPEPPEPLVLPLSLRAQVERLPGLLARGEVEALVVRGPRHGGRRTFLRHLARALGRGLLEVDGPLRADDERWRLLGSLSTLLHAMPVAILDLAPGETAELPPLGGADGPLGVVLGRQGGVAGPAVASAVTVGLGTPAPAERREHWSRALGGRPCAEAEEIADGFRMTSGNIRRVARLAHVEASLAGRDEVTAGDVRRASRSLSRAALDTLAVRLDTSGGWEQLALPPETARELRGLEIRCRHRERLGGAVGPALCAQLNAGVRALLHGPSGCGKTLATRVLAGTLQRDLYRLDLAAVVNKYLGETEKNLDRVFSLAEELDVVLLLDEGDSLLARRTQVSSSNDRYANLETNYLLQRVESFEGILVVCTNGVDLLDPALMRRMDFTIAFRVPDPAERFAVLRLHLPHRHEIDHEYLREVAFRCQLSPGQLRNAVLHAALLALSDDTEIAAPQLEEGLMREYRKAGATCPLRPLARG